MSIDYYAYSSKLRGINASYKALISVISLILCIAFNNIYLSIFIMISMGFISVFLGGMSIKNYLRILKIPLIFMILSLIAIVINVGYNRPTEMFYAHFKNIFFYITNYSLYQGICLLFKALGAVSAMFMLILSTPNSELISTLKKIHVPSIIIELMNLIYRYIFILLELHNNMKTSAEARLGHADFKTSCKTFGAISSNIFILSMKKANIYYNAMESRCYNGTVQFLEEERKITTFQIVIGILYILFLIVVGIFM